MAEKPAKKALKYNKKDSFGCHKNSKTAPNSPKKDQINPQKISLFIRIFSQILQKLIPVHNIPILAIA